MFFGNSKEKDIEIANLKKEINDFQESLNSQKLEFEEFRNKKEEESKKEIIKLNKELEIHKNISKFSYEEGLVAFDKNMNEIFKNERAA